MFFFVHGRLGRGCGDCPPLIFVHFGPWTKGRAIQLARITVDQGSAMTGDTDGGTQSKFGHLHADWRVRWVGRLQPTEVPKAMARVEFVVCPSYGGPAAVIFEAVSAEADIITTPHSGSVEQDGVHGRVVEPWDPDSLAAAVREAAPRREQLFEIGLQNASLQKLQRKQHGKALIRLCHERLRRHGKRISRGNGPCSEHHYRLLQES